MEAVEEGYWVKLTRSGETVRRFLVILLCFSDKRRRALCFLCSLSLSKTSTSTAFLPLSVSSTSGSPCGLFTLSPGDIVESPLEGAGRERDFLVRTAARIPARTRGAEAEAAMVLRQASKRSHERLLVNVLEISVVMHSSDVHVDTKTSHLTFVPFFGGGAFALFAP